MSIGQLCDSKFIAVFTDNQVVIAYNNNIVLTGPRDHTTGLWVLPSVTTMKATGAIGLERALTANNVYEHSTKRDLILYLHRCCFSPATKTWRAAINAGFFATWPGLSPILLLHLPKSEATILGHLHQQRQNIQSTKRKHNSTTNTDADSDAAHEFDLGNNDDVVTTTTRAHVAMYTTFEPTGQIYSDQTGRFPTVSSRGYKYIMIVYDYDSNAILAEPLSSKAGAEQQRAYRKIHQYLTSCGFRPHLQRLDNKAPPEMQEFMRQEQVDYQLVPPHSHCRNAAERAIQTFKNHFIAGLCSVDKEFPRHIWCRLLPQAVLTLNLLRP